MEARRKKKRRLYQLKAKEVEDIVSAHLQDGEQQTAIASRFGVSKHLVNHLVNRHKKTPLMEVKRQLKQQRKDSEVEAVAVATASMIRRGAIIESAAQIAKEA